MRKLGKVIHYSSVTKRLIAKAADQVEMQGYGVDLNGYVVAKIDEVFGPVSKPYYALKPSKKIAPLKYVGEQLFFLPQAAVKRPKRRDHGTKNRHGFGRGIAKA
jgi:rRNA processing protein Gar1